MIKGLARWVIPVLMFVFLVVPIAAAAAQGSGPTLYLPIISKAPPPPPPPAVKRVGPSGGTFTAVVIDPTNPSILYVGTFSQGVFKSLNGGQTWQAMNNGLGNLKIQSMAIHPNGTTLYAGTYGSALYRSTDGGGTWVLIRQGIPPDLLSLIVYDIELDPTNPNTIYATMRQAATGMTLNGFVFKSTDGGESWQQIWSGTHMFPDPNPDEYKGDYSYDIDVTPNGQKLYLAVHAHGVYQSPADANLNSWSPLINLGMDLNSRDVAIDPQTPTTLYQSVYFDTDGLYKSTNSGSNWVARNTGLAKPIYGFALDIDPINSAILYLGTANNGVYKSTDRAETWSNVGLYSQFIWGLDANGSRVYAGTGGGGLLTSSSGGGNWVTLNNGIFSTNVTGLVMFNGLLYAGVNGGGVYSSSDEGASWKPVNNGLADLNVQNLLVLTQNSVNNLYALTGTQLFKLASDASIWTVAASRNIASTQVPNAPVPAPQFEEAEPFIQNSVLPDEEQRLLSIDRTQPVGLDSAASYGTLNQITAAAAYGSDFWIGIYRGGVSKSNGECAMYDDGRTVYALHVSKADGKLYGSIPDANGNYTVIKLKDCTNWDTNGTGLPGNTPVIGFASNSTRTFAATAIGVYSMPPYSSSWTLSSGLSGAVYAIAADPNVSGLVYAAAESGAYVSTNNGSSWQLVPRPELQNKVFLSVVVDPQNPNLVYFGSREGSTYRWDKTLP